MTTFAPQAYDGTYAAFLAHDGDTPSWIYVLARLATRPAVGLALGDAWALTAPWALIVRDSPWDFSLDTLTDTAETLGLAAQAGAALILAWRADPSQSAAGRGEEPAPGYQTVVTVPNQGGRQTLRSSPIGFGNVILTIPVAAAVSLGADGSSLRIVKTQNQSQFSIGRADVNVGLLTFDDADLLTSAAGGVAAGGLRASGGPWPSRRLFLLGQDGDRIAEDDIGSPEVRFWWGTAVDQRLRLPLFARAGISSPKLGATFTLNPALPFDPAATRFDIAETAGLFTSSAGLLTRDGAAVGLAPVSQIGFHFARGIAADQSRVYLAPYGRFALVAPAGVQGAFRLMPGLSGLEFIEASGGDILDLVPGRPAFGAPAGADGVQRPELTSTCTTSWFRLTPSAAASRPYYAQPLSSVFYASVDGTSLPRAADAKVADLTGAEGAYPWAPYANAFADWLTAPPSADGMTAFEQGFLAGTRGAILAGQKQPVFSVDGTVTTGKGATPRGLFAEIGPTSAVTGRNGPADAATPEGQWRRLYLATGTSRSVTLEPSAAGVIDPVIGNALLQPELFLVYTNWSGHSIGCSGQIDIGGFTFNWSQADPPAMMVAKFSDAISLKDFFTSHQAWRDAATLVGDAAAIAAARTVFGDALAAAEKAKATGLPLFDDFLTRIAGDPTWTGLVVFGAPVDGNAMPQTLQVLIAGISGTLVAHHLAVDVAALSSEGGVPREPGPSAIAGVISYADAGSASPAGAGDYGFYTKDLQVGFFSSVVTSFNAEVGVTANKLFGRAVALQPERDDPVFPNTFLLKGVYHVIADVPTVTFQLPSARIFDFVVLPAAAGGRLSRVLDHLKVDSAGLMQPGDPATADGTTTHRAEITLSGQLSFAADPFGVGLDLFSYGLKDGPGLALTNLGLRLTFVLDEAGRLVPPPTFAVDYSRMMVTDGYGALRRTGMVGGLPFKLKGLLADEKGLDVGKLGGKPVQILQIAGQQTTKPQFALQFDMAIGSLGELSGVHAALTAEMRLGWGPLDTTRDADGAALTIQLPGASGGFGSLNVQGMLKLVFGDANLLQVPYGTGDAAVPVYAILFNNVALSVMGIKLPPKVVSDLILFSDPANATGSNLAACLAVRQQ